jgi:3-dehydrotetronate 4-kinase
MVIAGSRHPARTQFMTMTSASALLGCIADDFTGATDLANMLVRGGMRTVQTIGVPRGPLDAPVQAIVVALKSRTAPRELAVAESLAALEWLRARGCRQFYFKYCSTFDSTDDGNIGPVAEALMAALGTDFAIACPAFPEAGRTVYRGNLFVGDLLLNESGMQNHPLTPMTDANLVRVLQKQTRTRVGLLRYDTVQKGPEAIAKARSALIGQKVGLAIADAISDDDLYALGTASADDLLLTGGSGLAIGLPRNFARAGLLPEAAHAEALPVIDGMSVVLSGSCSRATNAQVAHWRDAGRPAFRIDPLALASGQAVVDEALAFASQHLAHEPVLIYATSSPDEVVAIQNKLGTAASGALVEDALASLALRLRDEGVRRFVVAGGETSGAVVQALDVGALQIGPQIDPGVPWTASLGSEPLALALKSGNFGATDFFSKALAVLEEARS